MFLETALQYRIGYLFLVLQCSVKAISQANYPGQTGGQTHCSTDMHLVSQRDLPEPDSAPRTELQQTNNSHPSEKKQISLAINALSTLRKNSPFACNANELHRLPSEDHLQTPGLQSNALKKLLSPPSLCFCGE